MTWAEFKAELEKLGIQEDDVIGWIDSHPCLGNLRIYRSPDEEEIQIGDFI